MDDISRGPLVAIGANAAAARRSVVLPRLADLAVILAVPVLALCLVSCSSDHGVIDPFPQRMSDVAEIDREVVGDDGRYTVYLFEGMLVHGDMYVSTLRKALSCVQEQLLGHETAIALQDYRLMPPSLPVLLDDRTRIRIDTCVSREDGHCSAGRIFLISTGSEFAVAFVGSWFEP